MKKAVVEEGWKVVPSHSPTIRYTKTETTPDYARTRGVYGGEPMYDFDTYDSLVFITLVGSTVILGTADAPGAGRRDREIPQYLALAILDDPVLAFDHERQHALKGGRRA
jgi:hypothetical protein